VPQQYDIFRKRFDGSCEWVEAAEDIHQAKKRLISLASAEPANYLIWDSSLQRFIRPFEECA